MLAKSVSALAVLAFAAHVSASEQVPYQPLVKMSVHQMFGLGRRQTDGYQPTQSECGTGATCAEACGAGFQTCASTDDTIHCFNPTAKETCCPDNSGNSCDDGYYCTADKAGKTWCCPNGLDLVACAAAFTVTGGLVSETAKPTTSASTSPYSVLTTSSDGTYSAGSNTTTTATATDTVTTCTSTLGASVTYPASNITTTAKVTVVPTTKPTQVSISGASTVGASVLSLLAVAAVAALL